MAPWEIQVIEWFDQSLAVSVTTSSELLAHAVQIGRDNDTPTFDGYDQGISALRWYGPRGESGLTVNLALLAPEISQLMIITEPAQVGTTLRGLRASILLQRGSTLVKISGYWEEPETVSEVVRFHRQDSGAFSSLSQRST